ncbi:MAG: 6-phosphofructokinase [Clostridiales bacterium]|nr:6-phosphofructokinase [Clostridiales bacterium]
MEVKNAIIGQSGGPTAAINATLAGVIEGCLSSVHIDKIFGMRHGIEGVLKKDILLLNDLLTDEYHRTLLKQTPASALGSCRVKLPDSSTDDAVYQTIFEFLKEKEIGYFFYIGGNDSMDTIDKLTRYAAAHAITFVQFIGVPKTIDNDLVETDHTPGYGSAAKYIAASMAEIARDCAVYTVPAVTIVEIMGRDAGWLTASAALSKAINGQGADYIYLPEIPFTAKQFYADITRAFQTHPNVIIAVSEGLRLPNGEYVGASGQNGAVDVFGHKYLAGTGKTLETMVRDHFACKVRAVEINILQRCAAHVLSLTDIEESIQTGKAAVTAAERGETGVMICMHRNKESAVQYQTVPVSKIANQIKIVPPSFINEEGNNVTDACISYLKPLIQGEQTILWENGLPKHFYF